MRSAIANGPGTFNCLICKCLLDCAIATEGSLVAIPEQYGCKHVHPPGTRA